MRTTNLLIPCVLAALAGASACTQEKKPEETGAAPAAGDTQPATPEKQRPTPMRPSLAPITVEEALPFIPKLAGAKVIKESQKAARSERVETGFCFEGGKPKPPAATPVAPPSKDAEIPPPDADVAAAGDKLKAALEAAGWNNVVVRQTPRIPDRMNVAARRESYVLTGAVQRGPFPDCPTDKGGTMVTVNVHKQTPRTPGVQPTMMRPLPGTNPGGAGSMPEQPQVPGSATPMTPPPAQPQPNSP